MKRIERSSGEMKRQMVRGQLGNQLSGTQPDRIELGHSVTTTPLRFNTAQFGALHIVNLKTAVM
jgi:hypothetical protein